VRAAAGAGLVNGRAIRRAERACCCPAAPAAIAVMPPSPGRPHRTEILLCMHHYRAHRAALEQAGAAAVDLHGAPVAPA
jgi:hypothetical protein